MFEIIYPGRALVKTIEITFIAALYDMIDTLIKFIIEKISRVLLMVG